MLGNEKVVVSVEVKANFTQKKVKHFIHKMEQFRSFFPECADKEVLWAYGRGRVDDVEGRCFSLSVMLHD